jgi:tRNA pseudouridine38-40 synthase
MRNVRMRLAYDGSRFFGWQRQEGFESVQEVLEEALSGLARARVLVHGSGRTDTGVHALGQTASFHIETRLGDERLLHALNAHLPEGVAIDALETCRDDFHAQRDALGKRYAYVVQTSSFRPPWGAAYAHWVPHALDLASMRRAAAVLRGRHDFGAFANAGSPRRSNVRTVRSLHLVARRRGFALVVEGEGFLYNMVRTLAGTLLDVGRGRTSPERVAEILASRERPQAGPTAPPEGLWLVSVRYREPCFGRPRRRAGFFPR